MVDVSPRTGDRMVEELARQGVVVRSCRSFTGLPDHYIRVSVGEDWENERFVTGDQLVMMCGITGTPGTGKSLSGMELANRGYTVVHLTDTVGPYVIGEDEDRDAQEIDTERWADEFVPVDGFVEGHFAHLLPCDRIIVLRCRPDELKARLAQRKYRERRSARMPRPKRWMSAWSRLLKHMTLRRSSNWTRPAMICDVLCRPD